MFDRLCFTNSNYLHTHKCHIKTIKKEKMLIMLDDICKNIDLEEIGIPSFSKDGDDDEISSKVVLICRDEEYMGTQICFPIKTTTG